MTKTRLKLSDKIKKEIVLDVWTHLSKGKNGIVVDFVRMIEKHFEHRGMSKYIFEITKDFNLAYQCYFDIVFKIYSTYIQFNTDTEKKKYLEQFDPSIRKIVLRIDKGKPYERYIWRVLKPVG